VAILPIFYEQLFCTKYFCATFMLLQFWFVIFWQKDFGAKAAHKNVGEIDTRGLYHKTYYSLNLHFP
jgi:hypothetical protein